MRTIFPIIFIIISIGLFFVFIDPIYNDVSSLRSDISVYNQALSNSTNLEKTRDSLLQKYNQVGATDKERLSRLLPDTVDNISLILEVQKIAQSHLMSLKNITFDAVKPDQPQASSSQVVVSSSSLTPVSSYGTFNLSFTTDGSYDTFVSFLNDLEHNLRLINIKNISFSVPQATAKTLTSPNPDTYNYNIKIETYWLKN